MTCHMTHSLWVTLSLLSHQSLLIPWPTACEWHCFISFQGSLINHVLSHNQQAVSDTALFLCITHDLSHDPQSVSDTVITSSSITSHPMTNSMWVTLLYFFARQSDQSCLIPWPTVCEWTLLYLFAIQSHQWCLIPWPTGSEGLFLYQVVSSIMSYPTTHSMWVTLLYFFARQSHQSYLIQWQTGSEWHCSISLPGSLPMSHLMTNRKWVPWLLYFFAR